MSSVRCWSPPDSGSAAEHAPISLLALNGLRVSEATGADIQALGIERGHSSWPTRVAAMRVRRAFAYVILSDAELGDLRLISRNGPAESACPATR